MKSKRDSGLISQTSGEVLTNVASVQQKAEVKGEKSEELEESQLVINKLTIEN